MSEPKAAVPKAVRVMLGIGLLLLAALGVIGWSILQKLPDFSKLTPDIAATNFATWRAETVIPAEGTKMEVALIKATPKFKRNSNISWAGYELPLGTTRSSIQVPATFRYFVDLSGDWQLVFDEAENHWQVQAPEIELFTPVAFETGEIQRQTKSGWARWDQQDNLEALERKLSSMLSDHGLKQEQIKKAQEAAKPAVEKFVRNWMLSQGSGSEVKIDVKFGNSKNETTP